MVKASTITETYIQKSIHIITSTRVQFAALFLTWQPLQYLEACINNLWFPREGSTERASEAVQLTNSTENLYCQLIIWSIYLVCSLMNAEGIAFWTAESGKRKQRCSHTLNGSNYKGHHITFVSFEKLVRQSPGPGSELHVYHASGSGCWTVQQDRNQVHQNIDCH